MEKPETLTSKALGFKTQAGIFTINTKQCILYALGIGFSQDPLQLQDLTFTYEHHHNFTVFPTFSSCLGQRFTRSTANSNPDLPEFQLHTVLHGSEKLVMVHSKLHLGSSYRIENQLVDVCDKGKEKGALLMYRTSGYLQRQSKEELAFFIERVIFARTLGGSGYKGLGLISPMESLPGRKPDYVLENKTFPNQAILYRLITDDNPLHIDPELASLAGFQKPILHGLATYGSVCRCVVQNLLANRPEEVKSIEVRFIGHVFPGETLEVRVWVEEGNKLFLQGLTKERKTKVIQGVVQLAEHSHL